MIFLLLSVLSSTILITVFKFFPKYGIDTFQAIVTNYFVCVICGSLVLGRFPFGAETLSEPWLPFAMGLGLLFVSGFYTVGMTVLLFGITVASVLQKMSLIISVPYAIIAFSEEPTTQKIVAITIALAAVVLSNWPSTQDVGANSPQAARDTFLKSGAPAFLIWFFPIYAFLASGAIECGLQYVQGVVLDKSNADANAIFSSGIFASAGIIGLVMLIYLLIRGQSKLSWKNLVAGVFLGIPNYFSIFFLLLAFDQWPKSVVLPVNNIAIVAASALLGVLIFREKLSKINWAGVGLAALAIVLISL